MNRFRNATQLTNVIVLVCLMALSILPQPRIVAAKVATAQIADNEARVIVRIIAEHPEQCPADNLRAYTYIYMEGQGVPDANGYIFATAHATTDLFILSGQVVSLAPRHHEMTYTVPIRLEQFPPVPMDGFTTTYSLEPIISTDLPSAPDVECRYVDGDGSVKSVFGNQEFAFRQLINTLKGALFGLGGMQRNAEGMYGVEGIFRARENSTFKYVAEWYPGPVTPAFDVVPDARGIFIGGLPIDIFYDYISTWKDDGALIGNASIKHGRGAWEKTQQPAPQTVRKTINPGSAIGQSTQMEGQVVLNNGNGSSPVKKPYESTPRISVFKPDNVDTSKFGEAVAYKFERAMPNPAWSAGYKFPSSFPAPLKSKELKAKAQMKILFESNSLEAPATIKAGIGGEGEATVGKVAGKLKVEGLANFSYTKAGFDFIKGTGKADFQIGYKDKYGPFDLVPQLKPWASNIGVDEWLEQYLRVEVGLYAIAIGNIEVYKGGGGLDWKAKVQPGLRISAKAVAGKDDSVVRAEVEAVGEGRLNLYLNDPAKPFFDGADGEVKFTAALIWFNNKTAYEHKINFGFGNVMQSSQTLAAPTVVQTSLASEGYLGEARWLGADHNTSADPSAAQQADDGTTVLLSKASPLAAPSMDVAGRAACWVAQRSAVPASRNMEIVCTTGNAPAFNTPITLTNDALADAAPSVALAAANAPLAAWWRHSNANLSESSPIDAAYMKQTQVMASTFDPNTNTWNVPVAFGNANAADYAPQVVGNGSNRGVLVWRENSAGEIGGFGNTPDTVKAAIYDAGGKTWGSPQSLTTTRGLITLQAAYGSNEAALLYAIDADGIATTTQDSEIWAQRNVSGSWQLPVRISNNSEADSSPRIAYDAANQPVLVWLRTSAAGQTFLMLQRGWGSAASATLLDGPAASAAPVALRDMAVNTNGDIVALWTAAYEGFDLQNDLTYAVFNAATNTWSAPLRLTQDAAQDDFANVTWKSANEFSVLYDRAALQTLTTTVTIDNVTKPVTYTVADPNGHDLVVRTHAIAAAQPAVQPGNLLINASNAAPNAPATVVAQVQNLGDLPASNVQVVLGASDARLPLAGAPVSAIATATLPSLRGGETLPVTLTVNLPARPNRLVPLLSCASACVAALGPSAVATTTLPDLTVVHAAIDRDTLDGATLVRAEIANTGVISAARAEMTVIDEQGVLGTSEIYITPTTGLLPGARTQGFFALDTSAEFTGSKALSVSVRLLDDAGNALALDFNAADNNAGLDWVRLPDWALGNHSAVLGSPNASSTPITLTAYNEADVAASAVMVQVYSTHPDEGGTLLWQGEMPAADAWGHAQVVAQLPGQITRVYVRLNLPEAVEEMALANNTVRVGRDWSGGGVIDLPNQLFMPAMSR